MRKPKTKNMASALKALEQLHAEADRLSLGVKAELINNINEHIASLKRLGFFYSLVPVGKVKGNGKAAQVKAAWRDKLAKFTRKDGKIFGEVSNKPCQICGFKTAPLHDGRRHRANRKPHAFTAADLTKLGLTRVD